MEGVSSPAFPLYICSWHQLFLPMQRLFDSECHSHTLMQAPPEAVVGTCWPLLAAWTESCVLVSWKHKLMRNLTSLRSMQRFLLGCVRFPERCPLGLLHCFSFPSGSRGEIENSSGLSSDCLLIWLLLCSHKALSQRCGFKQSPLRGNRYESKQVVF